MSLDAAASSLRYKDEQGDTRDALRRVCCSALAFARACFESRSFALPRFALALRSRRSSAALSASSRDGGGRSARSAARCTTMVGLPKPAKGLSVSGTTICAGMKVSRHRGGVLSAVDAGTETLPQQFIIDPRNMELVDIVTGVDQPAWDKVRELIDRP